MSEGERESGSAWATTREVVTGALRDLSRSWRSLALTDLACKVVAFALLTPATMMLLHWLMSRAGSGAIADADIARFFLTTRAGVVALVACGALLLAIVALEAACLMAIGLAEARGRHLSARGRPRLRGGARTGRAAPDRAHGGARPGRPAAVPRRRRPCLLGAAAATRHQLLPGAATARVLGRGDARGADRRWAGRAARVDDRPLGAGAAARPVRGRQPPPGPRRERPSIGREPLGRRDGPCRVGGRSPGADDGDDVLWSSSSAAASRRTSAARWRCSSRSSPGSRCCGPRSASRRESPASRSSRCSSQGSTCASASPARPRHPHRSRRARTRVPPGSSPVAPGRDWRPSRSSPRSVSRCSRSSSPGRISRCWLSPTAARRRRRPRTPWPPSAWPPSRGRTTSSWTCRSRRTARCWSCTTATS